MERYFDETMSYLKKIICGHVRTFCAKKINNSAKQISKKLKVIKIKSLICGMAIGTQQRTNKTTIGRSKNHKNT